MNMKRFFVVVFLFLFGTHLDSVAMNNSGTMSGNKQNLSSGSDFKNDGTIKGKENILLRVGAELSGKGLLKAPVIVILAKMFSYTGTIDCDKDCTVYTTKKFKKSMFKKKGKGKLKVTIIPEEKFWTLWEELGKQARQPKAFS